jgi:hypothetical protein
MINGERARIWKVAVVLGTVLESMRKVTNMSLRICDNLAQIRNGHFFPSESV